MPVVPMYSYLFNGRWAQWLRGLASPSACASDYGGAGMGWQRWEAERVLGDVDAREQLAAVVRVQVCDELACARRVQPRLA